MFYPPSPLHVPVLPRSPRSNTWPVLNSRWRMRCKPRQVSSHLKCQIIGSADRSVKTLSLLTLPCGRDWRSLSQEISIHMGACTRQCWTGHRFETQNCFCASSVSGFQDSLWDWTLRSMCLYRPHTFWDWPFCVYDVRATFSCSPSQCFYCLSGCCGWTDTRLWGIAIIKQTGAFSAFIFEISHFCCFSWISNLLFRGKMSTCASSFTQGSVFGHAQ